MPDSDAYQSLRRLLLAPASSTQHIALLDSNALFGSIGHFLAALSLPNATDLAHVVVASPALWTAPPPPPPPTHKPDTPAYPLVSRTTAVAHAAAFAVAERVPLITQHARGGARRELQAWVRAVLAGAGVGSSHAPPRMLLPQLAVLTGLLEGLAAVRRERARDAPSLGLARCAAALQHHWSAVFTRLLDSWSVARGTDAHWHTSTWALGESSRDDSPATAVLVLAALGVATVPDALVHARASRTLVHMAGDALVRVFGDMRGLFDDLAHTAEPLAVPPRARAARWAAAVHAHPLFARLGPLARLVGGAVRRCVAAESPDELAALLFGRDAPLAALSRAVAQLDAAWAAGPLAARPADAIAPPSRHVTTALWHAFKSLLFAATLVFDALVEAVVDQLPSPTVAYPPRDGLPGSSNIPPAYLVMLRHVLTTYMHLYFITASFGLDGFEAYRKVFYACLDVLGRDERAAIAALDELGMLRGGPVAAPAALASFAERTHTTYFLLVAEQLTADVPDALIEHDILPVCVPYLEDPRFQDTFESAHTVVLSLFAARRACAYELTPFYVALLLDSYPARLNDTQLETALTTVVASLSETSDAAAWWVIEQLHERLNVLQLAPSAPSAPSAPAAGTLSLEQALARCTIAMLPHVNLVLFRALLTRVHALIVSAPRGSAERAARATKTFDALAELNATTREEGMRWWLAHGAALTADDTSANASASAHTASPHA